MQGAALSDACFLLLNVGCSTMVFDVVSGVLIEFLDLFDEEVWSVVSLESAVFVFVVWFIECFSPIKEE